ncbi:LCP family protein [Clostridium disporicum]|uniref:Cell envelope-related function transcriptional attenuator n=1 Tax=Clostridium disporicum TaxID=84024 RepID=A0A174M0P4_9CLOT|nr:LCP family protein [Clostridium disporicum]CUP27359.1 cell envelope-related function transcriptional attenuator [Clostridium disporicum]
MKLSKGKKITLWVIGSLLTIIIATVATGYIYLNSLINKTVEVQVNQENIGITEEVEEELSKYSDTIINIALFGIDATDGGRGRSDSIMIATIDTHNKKLKLTSIMRDSYVSIEGYGNDKVNHAYAFGGPELAINTLNRNFNLNITEFASVNFSTLPKVIDLLGGVEIEIIDEEVSHVSGISDPGIYILTGEQALQYSRIRYASGGDYKRSERQRNILNSVFKKLLNMNVTQYPSLLNEILPMVETNLKSSDILDLGNEIIKMGIPSIEQERFPLDGYCQGQMIGGIYYLVFDKETAVSQLHNYIFEDTKIW